MERYQSMEESQGPRGEPSRDVSKERVGRPWNKDRQWNKDKPWNKDRQWNKDKPWKNYKPGEQGLRAQNPEERHRLAQNLEERREPWEQKPWERKREKPWESLGHVPRHMRHRVMQSLKSADRAETSERLTSHTQLMRTETAGGLEPEDDLDQTMHVRQSQIRANVDLATSLKASFRLDLSSSNLLPYTSAVYSRSSRSLLVSSRKGHISMMNWRNATLQCEMHLNETIRSATFLHNDAFFATAQKQHAFIYDTSGAQVHALRHHREPGVILSLPHHLLLATVSAPHTSRSQIVYTDTSTGEIVADHNFSNRTLALSAAPSATVNMSNGMLAVAHNSGVVSMWTPSTNRPLARVFCHGGGVRHVGVTGTGSVMVTAGGDRMVKATDLRTYKELFSFRAPIVPTALAISQREVVALAFGATVQLRAMPGSSVWDTAHLESGEPYMKETFSGKRVTGLDFCPFEDLLAVCHEGGMFSMLVPGSGEPTFDSSAPNPYETRKQRRESEVRSLLDKLPAESITLDADFVASVEKHPERRLAELKRRELEATIDKNRNKRTKTKMRGRNKISKVVRRKQINIIEAHKLETQNEVEQGQKTRRLAKEIKARDKDGVVAGTLEGRAEFADLPDALSRFLPKQYR